MKKTMEIHLSVLFESVYSLALNASIEANKFKCSFSDELSVIVLDFNTLPMMRWLLKHKTLLVTTRSKYVGIRLFQSVLNGENNPEEVIQNLDLQILSSKIIERRNHLKSHCCKTKLWLMDLNMIDFGNVYFS